MGAVKNDEIDRRRKEMDKEYVEEINCRKPFLAVSPNFEILMGESIFRCRIQVIYRKTILNRIKVWLCNLITPFRMRWIEK